MSQKSGTFEAFKDYTLAVVLGGRAVDWREPKIWVERTEADDGTVEFHSLEAGAKLLSAKNRELLRLIAGTIIAPSRSHKIDVVALDRR